MNLEKLKRYFRHRFCLVILVLILFIMGGIFGSFSAWCLNDFQKQELFTYAQTGLQLPQSSLNEPDVYVGRIIITNLQTVFFLFFMGISVIGVPLALLLLFTKGFILGFTVAFLLQMFGLKGLLLLIVGVLPHNLLLIPALSVLTVAIIDCAAALIKIRFTPQPLSLPREMLRISGITGAVAIITVFAGLIQGYITPLLTFWLSKIVFS